MRFIHTADWQIGKVFRRFQDKEPVLQQARLDVIGAIAALAAAEGATDILIAGDLYEHEAPSQRTLSEPLQRMRQHAALRWHVLPGNHDPHRPQGLWDRARALGLPANVVLHLEPKPHRVGEAAILPAPLLRTSETRDLTGWMDHAETEPGLIRIGLAHGSIQGFGGGEGEARNLIDPRRPERARLDYLALGDWHRTLSIGERVHYAGAPEPDRFGSQDEGSVLLVDVAGPGAPPRVERRRVGRYRWTVAEHRLDAAEQIDDLDRLLRQTPDLANHVMRLRLEGALSLAALAILDERLAQLEAAMLWLEVEREGLEVRPDPEDLERIDFDGVLRQASDRLLARSRDAALDAGERSLAADALLELYRRAAGRCGGPA